MSFRWGVKETKRSREMYNGVSTSPERSLRVNRGQGLIAGRWGGNELAKTAERSPLPSLLRAYLSMTLDVSLGARSWRPAKTKAAT